MTNNNKDIRWIQRFDSYQCALHALEEAVKLSRQRPLTRLEQRGCPTYPAARNCSSALIMKTNCCRRISRSG